MTIDDIYTKLDELSKKLDDLSLIDYESKNLKNVGNVVVDNDGNPLSVNYAKNSSLLSGKTYDEFLAEMKDYFKPVIESIKKDIKEQNDKKPLSASYIKEWTDIPNLDISKDLYIGAIDSLDFEPSYIEVLVKVDECIDKNGGSNKSLTQIPPIGISIDGLPFSENINNLKNYSGWWIEDNQVKIYLKKANFPQWIGKCAKMKFKIIAWR